MVGRTSRKPLPRPSITCARAGFDTAARYPRVVPHYAALLDHRYQLVAQGDLSFGTLSTRERIALALVLDRYDLLQDAWGSMLEAVHRLGPDWTQAALRIQRHGWHDEA
jgi:hypothetical protein